MEHIKELLNDEIQTELEGLNELELGSEEYKIGVDGVTKLVDKAIELEKIEVDILEKSKNREHELRKLEIDNKIKRELAIDSKKDQLYKNSIAMVSVIIPSIITIWGTIKTLKFEEEGTVTTIMGKGFINKLIPRK